MFLEMKLPQAPSKTAVIALSKVERSDYLGRCHATRNDATIDVLRALNIRHVRLTGYDKARFTRTL